MWELLSAAIKTMVTSVSTKNGEQLFDVANLFDFPKTGINTYPAITIAPAENTDPKFANTSKNQRVYLFSIKTYINRLTMGEEESERIAREITDSMIGVFDIDPYIGGVLTDKGFAEPIPSNHRFIQSEQVDVRFMEVLLRCTVIA